MFEKEAREYATVCWDKSQDPRDVFTPRIDETKFNDWRNGAEFGYNKANEWHYVKDGDLPKESCIVYYKDSFGVPSWSVVHPTWYIAGVEAFFKNNPQIIAWKEIVLPELPKESE